MFSAYFGGICAKLRVLRARKVAIVRAVEQKKSYSYRYERPVRAPRRAVQNTRKRMPHAHAHSSTDTFGFTERADDDHRHGKAEETGHGHQAHTAGTNSGERDGHGHAHDHGDHDHGDDNHEASDHVPKVGVKLKVILQGVDDVLQEVTVDVTLVCCFEIPVDVYSGKAIGDQHGSGAAHCHGDHVVHVDCPPWVPDFVFLNTPEPPHTMQQSYWRYGDSTAHFMIRQFTLRVKEKFNFSRFPFDRQAINIVMESHNCQAVPYPEIRDICGSKMATLEPAAFKGIPNVVMALDAAAHLWTLNSAKVSADTDGEGLTKVHTHARLQRRSAYYEWNIGLIMYLIVMASFCGFAIPLDSVADRYGC